MKEIGAAIAEPGDDRVLMDLVLHDNHRASRRAGRQDRCGQHVDLLLHGLGRIQSIVNVVAVM